MYIETHKEIFYIDSLHMSLNRFLLLVVGLWPYQQSKFVQIQLILLIGILTSFTLFQYTAFLTLKCTADLLINILSSALFFTMIVIKYILFSLNIKNVKYLLEQLQHTYNELTDENEISIIEKYSTNAKRYTITFSLLTVFIASSYMSYTLWPHISNILFFTNEIQSRRASPFITEYFIDKEKYFYLIMLHATISLGIGSVVMLATGTMLIVYLQHACGMFRIASYRIERAMTFKQTEQSYCTKQIVQKSSFKYENLIYKRLVCAVDMHRKAMKFSNTILSRFKKIIAFLIIILVVSASLNLFRIFQIISFDYDAMELTLHLLFSVVHIFYVFVGNYFGQEIIDHNNNIYATIYNIHWYVAPLQVQKVILFLLQRGTKAFTMNIAGLFVGSLQGAASMLNTAVSYFTVLHSTRN